MDEETVTQPTRMSAQLEDFEGQQQPLEAEKGPSIEGVATILMEGGKAFLLYKTPLNLKHTDLRVWKEVPKGKTLPVAKGGIVAMFTIPENAEVQVTRKDGSIVAYALKRGGTRCVNLGFNPAGGYRIIAQAPAPGETVKAPTASTKRATKGAALPAPA